MNKKILAVITNHSAYPTKKDGTGLWLGELTHFYDIIHEEAGYEIDFISPQGGAVPIDPRSLSKISLDDSTKSYLDNPVFMKRLENTFSPDEISFKDYTAIYYTGGHGTMWDFPDNKQLQEISRGIYENSGIVSAVCHGVSGLLNIKLPNGAYLIDGKNITGFSNFEETLVQLKNQVPFLLEDEIKKRGARYKKALFPFVSFAVGDKNLVTGQNPNSSKAVAKKLLEALRKQKNL